MTSYYAVIVERLFKMDKQNIVQHSNVLFLGFGYTAKHIAQLLDQSNIPYFSLSTRTQETLNPQDLAHVTHILANAPPNQAINQVEDPALKHYTDLIINQAPKLKWLGYLSATSVYGDYEGGIVTEDSECSPTSERGKNRLMVENLWQDLAIEYHLPLHIFRLSGIYGKDRNIINDVRTGKGFSIVKQNHLTNRIYAKDIAKALLISMHNPTPQEIFNLSDDMPASTAALNDYIAFLLNRPELPKFSYEENRHHLSAMRQSFYDESKVISNAKIKTILNLTLDYPTYRHGISDLLNNELMRKNSIIH